MADTFRYQERRDSMRLEMMFPALYTRFDHEGREFDQKISRSMDLAPGGVRLQSSFLVDCGEVLDITMALGEDLVTFKGKVVYVTSSRDRDQGIEFGISIQDIEIQDRITLTRFIDDVKDSEQRQDA